jgi:pimeloyl-ACP methyl ester carboxylesterase/DNA-binding CsgD family transcriptional regulator
MTREGQPEVRYCTAEDGVRIAYCVEGEGPPLFFCHYVYSFSLSHTIPSYDEAIAKIGHGRQLIRYDMRGAGLSQRDVEDLSPAADIRDIEAVVRALNLERFFMFGAVAGGVRAVEYAALHPDQVAGLVLYEAFPRMLDAYPRPLLQAFAQLCRVDWPLAARSLTDVAVRHLGAREARRWGQLVFDSVAGETMARMVEVSMDLDVSHLLRRVECPTLVCHSRNDPLWPFQLGVRMAEKIPNARLVLRDGDRNGPFTDPQSAIDAVNSFLEELQPLITPASRRPRAPAKPLTPREAEILRLIARGLPSSEISRQLSLSVRTVGRHITNMYDKIGARSRAEATAWALRQRQDEE